MSFERQIKFFDPSQYKDEKVVIVGCGGIGSAASMILAKMGIPKMVLIDGDTIEEHNIPNQLFPENTLGRPKVEVAAEIAKSMSANPDFEVEPIFEMADLNMRLEGPYTLVYGLDSLEARKIVTSSPIFGKSKYLVDARMGGLSMTLFCLDSSNDDKIVRYFASLDVTPAELPCTARAIIFTNAVSGGLIASSVRNSIVGVPNPFRTDGDMLNLSLNPVLDESIFEQAPSEMVQENA